MGAYYVAVEFRPGTRVVPATLRHLTVTNRALAFDFVSGRRQLCIAAKENAANELAAYRKAKWVGNPHACVQHHAGQGRWFRIASLRDRSRKAPLTPWRDKPFRMRRGGPSVRYYLRSRIPCERFQVFDRNPDLAADRKPPLGGHATSLLPPLLASDRAHTKFLGSRVDNSPVKCHDATL